MKEPAGVVVGVNAENGDGVGFHVWAVGNLMFDQSDTLH